MKAVWKQVRRHLRDGEQGYDQHNAHHAQAGNDSQCDEHHQHILERLHRDSLRTRKFPVEGNVNNRAQVEDEEDSQYHCKSCQQGDVSQCDGQDIAEQIGWKIRCKTRSKESKHDTQRHAQRPEYCDGGVLAHVIAFAEPFHSESRQYGKHGSRQDRGYARVQSQADASKRSVRQSAADKHQPPGHDICTDKPADNTCQQAADEGVLKEGILQ